MTNQIKNFIEEGKKELREYFDINLKPKHNGIKDLDREILVNFISSRQISLIKMIVEMVESEKKDTMVINTNPGGSNAGCKTCGGQENCQCEMYNQALDTISSKLLELTNGK